MLRAVARKTGSSVALRPISARVNGGHHRLTEQYPLYPSKRTKRGHVGMSVLCQNRPHALQQTRPIRSARWRVTERPSLFLASRPDGTGSPRCGTKALDQKIYEDLHLGRLMTARRQQSVQRVDLRILCVLQQELQQPLMDGARHHVFA